ncbi:hypothetical protein KKF84_15565 [Myxococcota bacterium]|nr:hypothetical protein [Myxococcota bacterium]
MATMLRNEQSSETHLNVVRRHIRLCGLQKGHDSLVAAIQPAYDDLIERHKSTTLKAQQREDALDSIILLDSDLDNAVRTAFEKCKQYDRENQGQPVINNIFPEGKFSAITSVSRNKEPDVVEKLALRIESLGNEHPLYGLAAELKQKVEASRQAIANLYLSITNTRKRKPKKRSPSLR